MTARHLTTAALTAALLVACTQTPTPTTGTLSAQGTADTYAKRQANVPSTPPETTRATPTTDLTRTYPGGGLHTQAAPAGAIPIVLVHGMLGFGRTEAFGGAIKYWGGLNDIQEDLKAQGYPTYTASMGPISSNYDRAVELYFQIKGGCVDYGEARAQQFHHDRRDPRKCYPGLYPQWDAQHPINLVGHSMGGTTARYLVHLLENGAAAERARSGHAPLYDGGRVGWVRAVMTISTPNSGSPAADNLQVMIPMFKTLILSLAQSAGVAPDNMIYDFDLGQYGLARRSGESYPAYAERVFNSAIWTTQDQAAYDLSPDGTAALNRAVGLSPNVYYFSWNTRASTPGLLSGWEYPLPTQNPVMLPASYPFAWPLAPGLGNMSGTSPSGQIRYDKTWWANDGLVPVKSMAAPLNMGIPTLKYTGQTPARGAWYDLGTLDGWDHIDITGNITFRNVLPFYRNQAAFLATLN
ncbi:lipase family alpha/beta hydrolase [Deinococcus maricopensis]|uniref:triacylglycerol lipase n=1 Tax=Deinococcus maricopensis (strain DSM 21211 / LMG 22137 / NRRL B-23946 / LB-34) TaxID=709986 RepID=E8U7U4_DEIML|nr:triacylglycerol lipase [Deinococcus maricopensis]ADV67133.1 Triacylglycerol lipase [Deinococcus maricopensis DSM 21211]